MDKVACFDTADHISPSEHYLKFHSSFSNSKCVRVCVITEMVHGLPSKKGPISSCSGKLIKVLSFFLWPVCLKKITWFREELFVLIPV